MNSRTKGIFLGIIVGLAWGLDSTLMGTIEAHPLVSAFFHDSFAFMWIGLTLMLSKQFLGSIKLLSTKKGKATAVAALVGAPVGMSAYLLAIKYATTPYASSISVIYPGIGALLSFLILKEKLSKRAALGIFVSLLGSFMLSFKPTGDIPDTFETGILFALLAVLGWASEGVIIGFAMKHIKDEDHVQATPQQFLCLRYFISMLIYGILIIPVSDNIQPALPILKNGIYLKFAGIAILGAITYLCWYKAVNLIGAAMGTALNSTAALWTIVFSILLFNNSVNFHLIIWGLVIVIGVFIFAIEPKKAKEEASC